MKIGILTYHRAHNYGALLQAIATRFILQKMGHKVYYIDYWPKYHQLKYKFFSFNKLRANKFNYLISRIVLRNEILKRIDMFLSEISKYIAPFCTLDKEFDAIIYGSDQIWRKQHETGDYNSVYFADTTYSAPIRVSYAASMGNIKKEDSNTIATLMKNFTAIGVREEDLQGFIENLGFETYLNVDPTMLFTAEDWDEILSPKRLVSEPYLLYYSLNKGVFDIEVIKEYALQRGLRIIEICGEAQKERGGVFSLATLSDFLSLIKYADVVFSTSFHGLAFSILYHKQVFVSNKTNAQRQRLLVERLGLGSAFLEPQCKTIPSDLILDYVNADIKLNELRIESISFLKKHLSDARC